MQMIVLIYNAIMNNHSNCIMCGSPLQGRQKKYCSIACKNRDLQSYEAQKRRGLTRKLELVKTAGGCCSICGYRDNLAALVFHHTDSTSKDFKLDMRSLSNRKLDPVIKEIDKCVLICANCHAELHNPHLKLDQLL
jgi:predicted nucleic acid-binding Zn ribbon protein